MYRNGDLYVYSGGHEYILKNIGEDVACYLIDQYRAFHEEESDESEEHDLPEDYDYLVSLKYSGVDALVWNAV